MARGGDNTNLVQALGRDGIVGRWAELASQALGGRLTTAEVARELEPLHASLATALATSAGTDVAGDALGETRAVLAELSRDRALQGFTPSETASTVFAIKEVVLELVEDGQGLDHADFATFSTLVDDLGLFTFETYAATRERVIASQAEQLLELSTPVVKLWDGIVAVPLVGTLDSARTQVVMEALLQALVDTGSAHAIIDITGVAAVDTQVAQHLLKTIQAARLMGAECVVSGISPQVAQTIVALGIEFGDIVTKATLADALRLTLGRIGAEVVVRRPRQAR